MGKIFVNYRREDSAPYALSIAQYLENAFGKENVFVDIDRLRPGERFAEVLRDRLRGCSVMVVVIGPSWLAADAATGWRRIDVAEDWVRLEIAAALAQGIRIIPLLVGGAHFPDQKILPPILQPLAERQYVTLTTNGFRYEMAGLANDIGALVPAARGQRPPSSGRKLWLQFAAAVIVGFLSVGTWLAGLGSHISPKSAVPLDLPSGFDPSRPATELDRGCYQTVSACLKKRTTHVARNGCDALSFWFDQYQAAKYTILHSNVVGGCVLALRAETQNDWKIFDVQGALVDVPLLFGCDRAGADNVVVAAARRLEGKLFDNPYSLYLDDGHGGKPRTLQLPPQPYTREQCKAVFEQRIRELTDDKPSIAGWVRLTDPEAYARNYQKNDKAPNELFPQTLTAYAIPMSQDRKSGVRLSENEYLEIFKLPVRPDSVVFQVRLDLGSRWLLSRQTFSLTDRPKLISINPESSEEAFNTFHQSFQNEIDTARHGLRADFQNLE